MSDDHTRGGRGDYTAAVLICCVLGAAVIGVSLSGDPAGGSGEAAVPDLVTEEYGRRLLANTPALLGPDHADPEMRYSGSRLSCSSYRSWWISKWAWTKPAISRAST